MVSAGVCLSTHVTRRLSVRLRTRVALNAAGGVTVGVTAAWFLSKLLATFLFATDPRDLGTFAPVSLPSAWSPCSPATRRPAGPRRLIRSWLYGVNKSNPKLQIPNPNAFPTSKSQAIPKTQFNRLKLIERGFGIWFGIWALGMRWDLGFGAWDLLSALLSCNVR